MDVSPGTAPLHFSGVARFSERVIKSNADHSVMCGTSNNSTGPDCNGKRRAGRQYHKHAEAVHRTIGRWGARRAYPWVDWRCGSSNAHMKKIARNDQMERLV
jgi:hypothetical protein